MKTCSSLLHHAPRRLLAALLLSVAVGPLSAATINKATTGTDLTSGASWVGGTAPGSADVATWVAGSLGGALTLPGAASWQGLDIQGATAPISITGPGPLTLGSAGLNLATTGVNFTNAASLVIGADQTWTLGTGRVARLLTGGFTLAGGTTLTLAGSGTLTNSQAFAAGSAGALVVNGPLLVLDSSGANRSGPTTLSSGTIAILNNTAPLGTGPLFLNGGRIGSASGTGRILTNATAIGGNVAFGGSPLGSGTMTFSNTVNLSGGDRELNVVVATTFGGGLTNGTITKTGANEINIASNSLFSGPLTINQGKIGVSHVNGLGGTPDVTIAAAGTFSVGGGFVGGEAVIGNLSGSGIVDTAFNTPVGTRTLRVTQTTDATFSGRLMDASGSRVLALNKDGAATLTLTANNHTYTGPTTITAGTLKIGGAGLLGPLSYAGAITNNATLEFATSASQTLASALVGTGTLLKSGSGTLTLTGDGSGYTGTISVTGGRLLLNGSLAAGVTVGAGGTLGGATGTSTSNLMMAANSTLALDGGGTTTATTFDGVTLANPTYVEFSSSPVDTTVYDVVTYGTGGLTGFVNLVPLVRGTLTNDTANNKVLLTAGAPGVRTWNTGNGTWNRFGTLLNWAEGDQKYYQGDTVFFGDRGADVTVTLEGSLTPGGSVVTVSNTANAYTFTGTGTITGGVGLEKANAGTLILANDNTYSGATTISGGVLRVGNGGTNGTLGSGAVANDATLVFNRSDAASFPNVVSGTGTLVKEGTNTLTLTGTLGSFNGGDVVVNAGTLQVGGTETSMPVFSQLVPRTVTVNTNGTLEFIYRNAFGTIPSTPTTTVVVNGGTVRSSSGLSGAVTILQDPTLLNGATVEATKDFSVFGTYQLQGTVTVGGTIPSAITTAGGLVTVGNGLNNLGITTFDVADVSGNAAPDLTIAAVIRNSGNNGANVGGLTKTGAGTLRLTATNTYTGATTVQDGTLRVDGVLAAASAVTVNTGATLAGTGAIFGALTIESGGTLAVGPGIGTLTVTNALTFQANATNAVDINAATSQADLVTGFASATFDGHLVVNNVAGVLAAGQNYQLFSAGGTGSFASITPATPGPGLNWSFDAASGVLSVTGSVATYPTNITATVSGGNLQLTWPATHLGWQLQVQTNTLAVGINTNWTAWPGSTTTNAVNVPINAANPAVFLRLVYPPQP